MAPIDSLPHVQLVKQALSPNTIKFGYILHMGQFNMMQETAQMGHS